MLKERREGIENFSLLLLCCWISIELISPGRTTISSFQFLFSVYFLKLILYNSEEVLFKERRNVVVLA